MKKLTLLISLLILNGCGGAMVATKCYQLPANATATKFDKIKKIAVEEAGKYGFPQLTTEIRPTKHNNFEGNLIFKTETSHGTDSLFLDFEKKDVLCVHGGGLVARPDTAIAAILERLDKL